MSMHTCMYISKVSLSWKQHFDFGDEQKNINLSNGAIKYTSTASKKTNINYNI